MGNMCVCCNHEKASEINVVVQPSAIETFIHDESLHSFVASGSEREPAPFLALPPLSEENSVKSKASQGFFRGDFEMHRIWINSQRKVENST
jgi:hypothetical protein